MYHTIQLSSCVSVQGTIVERLENGEVVISDGHRTWRGRPITEIDSMVAAGKCARSPELRP